MSETQFHQHLNFPLSSDCIKKRLLPPTTVFASVILYLYNIKEALLQFLVCLGIQVGQRQLMLKICHTHWRQVKNFIESMLLIVSNDGRGRSQMDAGLVTMTQVSANNVLKSGQLLCKTTPSFNMPRQEIENDCT